MNANLICIRTKPIQFGQAVSKLKSPPGKRAVPNFKSISQKTKEKRENFDLLHGTHAMGS